MSVRWLALAVVVSMRSFAQADLPDAGLPDAAVGGTGSERGSEEEEDSTSNPCLSDRDCDRGFQCLERTCTWRAYRDATAECSTSAATTLVLAALFISWRTSRSRRRKHGGSSGPPRGA